MRTGLTNSTGFGEPPDRRAKASAEEHLLQCLVPSGQPVQLAGAFGHESTADAISDVLDRFRHGAPAGRVMFAD
jgi:hypothetical protein